MLSEKMSFTMRWQELKCEDQCRLFNTYSSHFPIEVRFAFADWIDSKPWFSLDVNNFNDIQSANNLVLDLINQIKLRADFDEGFVAIAEQIVRKYSVQPLLLFDSIKQCLITESQIFQSSIPQVNINSIERQPVFPIDPIQENNNKILAINTQIHYLETNLPLIQQNSGFAANHFLDANQIQYYFDSCKKYIDKQNEIIFEMLSMKDILIDTLKEWKLAQKCLVIDGFYENNICQIYEWRSSLLNSLKRALELLMQFRECVRFNNQFQAEINEINIKIDNMFADLINDSLVIEEQPNCSSQSLIIITKTRFEAKVRLLIPNNFITNQVKVRVRLLSAQEVNRLNNEGINSLVSRPPICKIEKDCQLMNNDKKELSAYFSEMKLSFIGSRKTNLPKVAEEKFTLLFDTTVHILNRDFTLCALSLPIVVISKFNCDALATILWDIGFAQPERELFRVPEHVPWPQLAHILSRKFKSETGVGLSDQNLRFIASVIPQPQPNPIFNNEEMISWAQFTHIKLQERNFTFWEWFYEIMVLTRELLCDFWKKNLIIGFISSEDSEKVLKQCCDGTFLLRFSESLLGSITINYVQSGQFIKLCPSNANDLKFLSLQNRIRNFKSVQYLYPNIPKDQAFGEYYTEDNQRRSSVKSPYTPTDLQLIVKIHNEEIPSIAESDPRETNDLTISEDFPELENIIASIEPLNERTLPGLQSFLNNFN